MRLEDFDYPLPPELIAQEPIPNRSGSRLLMVERRSGSFRETCFTGIVPLLQCGDLLVVNDTRVIPARLVGVKESGGRVEVFLVRRVAIEGNVWSCLIKCSKPPRFGTRILFAGGMTATVAGRADGECWQVRFSSDDGFRDWLDEVGAIPLPPYIRRPVAAEDRERYQTVFARVEGAVAAPTAGLHFSEDLLQEIAARGVDVVSLTLHVGLGTFLPIRVSDIRNHRMHREAYDISEATALAVNKRKLNGGRVIAVGTTVARTLEQASAADGTVAAGAGEADIFIYPGYRFRAVDALVTNFHLPQSTLLMLVSAFAGKELVFDAYAEAVRKQFRFFSYGDAMFIV